MTEPLHKTVRVRCSIAHAFRVFTERVDLWWPPHHRRLSGSTLRFEPQTGGRFVEERDDETKPLGEIEVWEPPDRVVFTWWPGAVDAPTRVEVRFLEVDSATVVEVIHSEGESGLADRWPGRVAIFGRNWDEVLAAFRTSVEEEPG